MGLLDDVFRIWQDALAMAFAFAKAARTAELRADRRVKGFDARALHMYSTEWGRVWACEELVPELANLREHVDPVTMRAEAAREAEDDFLDDVRSGEFGGWHRR